MEALRLDPPIPVSQIMYTTEEISTKSSSNDKKEEVVIDPNDFNPKSRMKKLKSRGAVHD